ncbi:outer membrane protein assembly factor BamB family protein [Planctomicrobium piriforme]|uniref:Pyrrolo-quinoline quinone repeat domain-containing protein n=1 Tax=Planctomicrobium piriforme TaxID=1576369 RepID=A0A1I3BE11_9PLAN|nr:PQQ-binding-like beta-propeller repeat protein [Planctomicrobium piriforme]SFH60532.1 hypothetical protein SAMN05421753_101405 [Planctomicrobium piriforme]
MLRLLSLLVCLFIAARLQAEDWPVWRGPTGNNIAAPGQNLPEKFGEKENVVWKIRVPGRGHSSPIVVGNRIFLTTADEKKQVQSVVAFDRTTGKQQWKTDINQGGFPDVHKANTHASPTIACNGETLYALFHNHDRLQLAALSLDGKKQGDVNAGAFKPQQYQFGCGLSPLLYKSLVIVPLEYEQGDMAAFEQKSGKEAWRVPRKQITFSSAIVAPLAGRDQLLLSGQGNVQAYDPTTGAQLWSVPGATAATCGTVAWEGDMIFASGGYPDADTVGIRVSGTPEVLWHVKEKCYEQSLLAHNGYVYGVNEAGIAFCWRGSDGNEMWKTRLCGPTSASPVLADGVIYQADERGKFIAFRETPEKFEKIFETRIGDEIYATPTICNGRMYLRTADGSGDERRETLYCFGKGTAASP